MTPLAGRPRAPTKVLPSADFLHECLSYDQETGELRWKTRPPSHFPNAAICTMWNARFAAEPAGIVGDNGYQVIHIKCDYAAHRIVWKMMTGEEPPETIDHKNMSRADNRWTNLRAATAEQQQWNSRKRKPSALGKRGVHQVKNRFQAMICKNGVKQHIGLFKTVEEASAAYETAARQLHGEFFCVSRNVGR
jgi:hypothetical protein